MKLNASQIEKDYLIDIGKLGSHLKTRSVTLITVRSAFKLHGSKMLVGMLQQRQPVFLLLTGLSPDGKLVVDDYNEEKAMEIVLAAGLKPGDPASELIDPGAMPAEPSLAALAKATEQRERGPGLGLYRAGGATTIFGGIGLGPYSDGPLNAVKKSMLKNEGLDEVNWMFEMARRTAEANLGWAKGRREALSTSGKAGEKRGADENADDRADGRKRSRTDEHPLGVYEAHSGIAHCSCHFFVCFWLLVV